MDIITFIRWVIFITFLLLVVAVIAGAIWAYLFSRMYVKRHLELIARLDASDKRIGELDQRLSALEQRHEHKSL